jgi:Na+-transporting NADH:ubiquinone oxidoreductase subunit NqrE
MPPRIARLIGLGAFGAIVVFVAIYALVVYASVPRSTGGIDITQASVTWIALGLVVLAVIGVHVVVGRGLLAYGRGLRRVL